MPHATVSMQNILTRRSIQKIIYAVSSAQYHVHPHTHDLISKSHAANLTVEECAPTHTHNRLYFSSLQNAKHYHTYMHACWLSVCQHITAEPSIHPSLTPIPPSLPSHLPGLQQGHTPQLPCAHTHTDTQRVREGVRQGGKIGKEGARADFTLP